MSVIFLHVAPKAKKGLFPKVIITDSRRLPFCLADINSQANRRRHERMVEFVDGILSLHKELAGAQTPTDKTAIQRQISATDRQIDQLVYELYGLTDDEIRIVENDMDSAK